MKPTNIAILSVASLAFALLQGCASIPKSQAMDNARTTYTQAEGNADVQKYATVDLYDAKLALQKAERAKNLHDQEHLAYLAKRQAEITLLVAKRKNLEASLGSMSAQRDQMRIELRGKEAHSARLDAQAANSRVQQLEAELANAKKTDRGLVLTLGDVVFETGKANLAPGAARTIDKLVAFLNANPSRRVAVEGHTDSRGSDDNNMDLSRRRAEAVANSIISGGIARDRLTIRGFGETTPVANNNTAVGRQLNRRVEIIVLAAGKV